MAGRKAVAVVLFAAASLSLLYCLNNVNISRVRDLASLTKNQQIVPTQSSPNNVHTESDTYHGFEKSEVTVLTTAVPEWHRIKYLPTSLSAVRSEPASESTEADHSALPQESKTTSVAQPRLTLFETWSQDRSPNSNQTPVTSAGTPVAEVNNQNSVDSDTSASSAASSESSLVNTSRQSLLNTECIDALCTQYLSKTDLKMFRYCTKHTEVRYTSLDKGLCRFMDGTSRSTVALASFPGSGNTWVRGLLEKATGICTGSVYCDGSLRVAGFSGEGVVGPAVLAVKTHKGIQSFQAVIHVVRCPGDAIVSERHRKNGTASASQGGGKHTALASPQQFGDNPEWDSFLHEYIERWCSAVIRAAKYQKRRPLLRVFYEDLETNVTHQVQRMLDFLHVPYSSAELRQRLESGFQNIHRKKEHSFDPFTEQQRAFLKKTLQHLVNVLTVTGHHDSVEYVRRYMHNTCVL